MVKDPVCGMEIEPQDAAVGREHMGQTFYFCSPNCVAQFDADPHRFAQGTLAATEAPLPMGSATTGFNPALRIPRHLYALTRKDARPTAASLAFLALVLQETATAHAEKPLRPAPGTAGHAIS